MDKAEKRFLETEDHSTPYSSFPCQILAEICPAQASMDHLESGSTSLISIVITVFLSIF